MAYLRVDQWQSPMSPHAHRYISREKLLALLLKAPPLSHIVVNDAGNLNFFSSYPTGRVVGYLDLGEESYLSEVD
jgi:hypothetical protein